MILVSVGTQLPFDRLIKAVDEWAIAADRQDVIAQTGPSQYRARGIKSFQFLAHEQFRDLQADCSVMVSHAGMGSIITAMQLGKPIILLARDHRRGEHRNGHQLATLKQFRKFPGVYAAEDEAEVCRLLDQIDSLAAKPVLSGSASADLIQKLSDYVHAPRPITIVQRVARLLR